MVEHSGRLQRFNQMFERQVLMRVSCQIGLAHLDDEIIQGLIRFDASAQHKRIDEKSNKVFGCSLRAVGNRRPNQDVGWSAPPGQQERKDGVKNHEQTAPMLAGKRLETSCQGRIEYDRHSSGAALTHG